MQNIKRAKLKQKESKLLIEKIEFLAKTLEDYFSTRDVEIIINNAPINMFFREYPNLPTLVSNTFKRISVKLSTSAEDSLNILEEVRNICLDNFSTSSRLIYKSTSNTL
jgi:hypothetical protein